MIPGWPWEIEEIASAFLAVGGQWGALLEVPVANAEHLGGTGRMRLRGSSWLGSADNAQLSCGHSLLVARSPAVAHRGQKEPGLRPP